MAVTGWFYGNALTKAFAGEIVLTNDIYGMLLDNTHTPDKAGHDYLDDVVADEITGTGYTANGVTLASVTLAVVVANSWATSRANSTAYVKGQTVRPATGNGCLYQCITAGTSGGSIPTYSTTIGETVTDGTVTWLCAATYAAVLDSTTDPTWNPSTISGARYFVVYDRTPATNATRPLIAGIDFGQDSGSSNSELKIQFDATGIVYALFP